MSNEIFNNLIDDTWATGAEVNQNIQPLEPADVVGEYARGSVQQAETATAAAREANARTASPESARRHRRGNRGQTTTVCRTWNS